VPGTFKEGLPLYSIDDVAKHATLETGIWVYYKNGVYDITEFVRQHPGGTERIMMAAGRSIEPFWRLYAQHHNPHVYEILEEWRIGNLDAPVSPVAAEETHELFRHEPSRSPLLRVLTERPFNAEPPPAILTHMFVTPIEVFFVRNHLPVPSIDVAAYRLELRTFDGTRRVEITLDELKSKFQKHVIIATIQCGGNRRDEFSTFRKAQGLAWGQTGISTATWGGVLLRDVLEEYQLWNDLDFPAKHVHLIGLDNDGNGTHFAASIPIYKLRNSTGDVLLAYEMNGVPLPIDHGFPLRAIVPGTVGARNVKWLGSVVLAPHEVQSHWQTKDYRILSPGKDLQSATDADYQQALAIQDMPVTSAICSPSPGTVFPADTTSIDLAGFAFAGGGRRIARVDVSTDGGNTWVTASLINSPRDDPSFIHPDDFPDNISEEALHRYTSALEAEESDFFSGRTWHWALWSVDAPVAWDPQTNEALIYVKAVDEGYNTQPRDSSAVWNARGLLNTSWHSIRVKRQAPPTPAP
jgi:sulfite oxidase